MGGSEPTACCWCVLASWERDQGYQGRFLMTAIEHRAPEANMSLRYKAIQVTLEEDHTEDRCTEDSGWWRASPTEKCEAMAKSGHPLLWQGH